MVNTEFINAFQKPFWLLNTARGKCVVTADLVKALESNNVLLSPHVAGWTIESKEKLAQTIIDKIKAEFH